MKMHFDDASLLEEVDSKDAFDLTQLKQVKKLSITAEQECVIDRSDPDRPRDYGADRTWRPTNLLKRLPASLEHLKLMGYVFRWGIDLDGLGDDLLLAAGPEDSAGTRAQNCAKGRDKDILKSLRRLKLVTTQQDHRRSFNKDAQMRDDKLRRGIGRLMTGLPLLQEIKRTQTHRLS
ncbi:hypothetical protein A1O7_00416 [Cladophialophora yegresii CBS 114405]|uniref:Uncharacterized protein n=1 Tax=Cladophialophora yegresii CBS 114405 TaxID=1182544 RepID=W9WGG0_9EURO|nr:uncharacterized protein A1O7_00416 [Cladophialophora yegresii CBS 114405]EXJ64080.1 hypothetical protein A1O7_00416 [Cladophialophora yegresii CBS 114405]